jgi:hypothetical protein
MRVVLTTVLELPDSQMDVNSLEAAITREWRNFPSQAWNAVAQAVEQQAERDHRGSLRRKGRESSWWWTTAGPVQLTRQRYLHPAEPRSFLLFDRRIGLACSERGTAAVQQVFAKLAALGPSFSGVCRQALLLWGDAPAQGTVWRWTQNAGQRLEQQAIKQRKAFLSRGELPAGSEESKPFVAIETDSTFVHAWRRKAQSHEVYLGVAYDGKLARGKRRSLTGKMATVSCDGSANFGLDLFLAVQQRHNVCEAQTVLYLSDGAAALENIRDQHFPMAAHQLDRAHLMRRVREAYGWDLAQPGKRLLRLVLSQKKARAQRCLTADIDRYPRQAASLRELEPYVFRHWDWLFRVRHLRLSGKKLPPHVEGSGVIERNVGVYIGQRMKRRGMGWTKQGASNILRIRLHLLLQAS